MTNEQNNKKPTAFDQLITEQKDTNSNCIWPRPCKCGSELCVAMLEYMTAAMDAFMHDNTDLKPGVELTRLIKEKAKVDELKAKQVNKKRGKR